MSQPATSPPSQGAVVLGNPALPRFEGAPVHASRMVISGLSTVDAESTPTFTVDDRVRLIGEFKCIGIRHEVDKKSGEIIRVQVLSPINVDTCPWDPADPNDDGVLRAR